MAALRTEDAWDPQRYEHFADERSWPFHELVELVHAAPDLRVVDLGCGTGKLTRSLHETLRARRTVGVDRSSGMLRPATPLAGGSLSFVQGSIEDLPVRGPFDLVFSNAALHWVADHDRLLHRLRRLLAPGGQLAVQVPANHDEAPHRAADEVSCEEPFASALDGYRREVPVLPPQDYARVLEKHGYVDARVWLRVYGHRLESREAVVDWTRGTLLTDYTKRLPEELHAPFLDRFRESLVAKLPDERPFFFPFRRILFHAFAGRTV